MNLKRGVQLAVALGLLLGLSLETFAQFGSCGPSSGGPGDPNWTALLLQLINQLNHQSERIELMLLNHNDLQEAVKSLDRTVRTTIADVLVKYDAVKKERDDLLARLNAKQDLSQDQAIIDARTNEVKQITSAVESFGGSL